jgi:hypothetical protein
VTAMALSRTDPNVAFECSSQTSFIQVLRQPFESALAAAVGMMDEAHSWAPPLDRHGERGDGELGAHVVAHGPTDHLRVNRSRITAR